MSLLLILLDTLIRGAVLVGIFFGGRYLIREARQGFPSLYTEDVWEVEQCKDFTCGECHACESYNAYQHGELVKSGCGCKQPCYCHFYEEYK